MKNFIFFLILSSGFACRSLPPIEAVVWEKKGCPQVLIPPTQAYTLLQSHFRAVTPLDSTLPALELLQVQSYISPQDQVGELRLLYRINHQHIDEYELQIFGDGAGRYYLEKARHLERDAMRRNR
ncbi:MAG: hypothetical protein AAFR61_30870 [Bacteroidota bacterium]